MITYCTAANLTVVSSQAGTIQATSDIVAAIVVVTNIASTSVVVANIFCASVVASNIATPTIVIVSVVTAAAGATAGGVNGAVSCSPDSTCKQSHAFQMLQVA